MFKNTKEFIAEFETRLGEKYGRTVNDSHVTERYDILGTMVRDYAGFDWRQSREDILKNREKHFTNTFPDGTSNELTIYPDGTRTVKYADGTIVTQVQGPDPRWGMLVPLPLDQTLTAVEASGMVAQGSDRARLTWRVAPTLATSRSSVTATSST